MNKDNLSNRVSYHVSYNKLFIYLDNELLDDIDFNESDNEELNDKIAKDIIAVMIDEGIIK